MRPALRCGELSTAVHENQRLGAVVMASVSSLLTASGWPCLTTRLSGRCDRSCHKLRCGSRWRGNTKCSKAGASSTTAWWPRSVAVSWRISAGRRGDLLRLATTPASPASGVRPMRRAGLAACDESAPVESNTGARSDAGPSGCPFSPPGNNVGLCLNLSQDWAGRFLRGSSFSLTRPRQMVLLLPVLW